MLADLSVPIVVHETIASGCTVKRRSTACSYCCTNNAGTCSATYPSGTSVTLNETPASNWTFSGWSGPCSGNNPSCTVVVSASVTASATFNPRNTLTVSESGQGTVTSTDGKINCTNNAGTCSATYASGTSVTLNETPASNWTFSGWSGPCSGNNPSCTVVVSASVTASATFNPRNTLTVSESGQGTVTSTDGKINCTNNAGTCSATYPGGTSVTLNETPAGNWTFSGWSGPCSGNNPSCTMVGSASVTASATFDPPQNTLTVSKSGQGTVTSTDGKINCTNNAGTCSATYPSGTSVTLNETPASNWTFSGWSGQARSAN